MGCRNTTRPVHSTPDGPGGGGQTGRGQLSGQNWEMGLLPLKSAQLPQSIVWLVQSPLVILGEGVVSKR